MRSNRITTNDLAKALGVGKTTLWQWTLEQPALRACQVQRGFYDVRKLVDAGYLREDPIDYEALAEALAPKIAAAMAVRS